MAGGSAPQAPAGPGPVFGFVAAILGALVCFIGAVAALSALGRPHDVPSALLAVAAAGFGGGTVVLGWLAVRLARPFGSGQPRVRISTWQPGARMPTQPTRVNARASRIIGTVVVLVVVASITALGVNLHARSARSSYTQHHGLAREGVVTSVSTVHHDSRYDTWTSYDYDVRLAAPVGDATETVLHDPTSNFQRFDAGERIDLLVDPRDVGYAELPGKPVQSAAWYVGPLVLGLVFVALVTLIALRSRSLRRRRASPEAVVRSLWASGRLAEAAAHVDDLGPYGVAGPDVDTSLGAAVLEDYADQLAATDRDAADAAYLRAADLQRAFASGATAGGEGLARMDIAARIQAKARSSSG